MAGQGNGQGHGDSVSLRALQGIPLVAPGDDIAALVIQAVQRAGITPLAQDVFVIAQKIVSKAEGRLIELESVTPSPRALELAERVHKDARLIELILRESREVVKVAPGVLIVEHRLGFVMANAGVDQSNVEHPQGRQQALLLPENPDASCAALKARLDAAFGASVAVVINDSFGRPWRQGVTGVALGCAGLPALQNLIGAPDLFGRAMRVTEIAFADELAAAASMVMGQADEGRPVIHVRGLGWSAAALPAAALLRPRAQDLFR